jgi:RNA polymerase sigma-70 factor, ECF subfamily
VALSPYEFKQLVDNHSAALYRMAYRLLGDRHEAEDIVQETFRSAWKSRTLFEEERGARAWLASILRRRVIDKWRRIPQPKVTDSENALEIGVSGSDPFELEYTDEMQTALQTLPEELRETLLLVVVAELTHQETADVLQIPLGTVLSRVSRARNKLREVLTILRTQTKH